MQGVSKPGNAWSLDEAPTLRAERRSAERVSIEVDVSLFSESQFFAGLSGDVAWVVQNLFNDNYTEYIGANVFNQRTYVKLTLSW